MDRFLIFRTSWLLLLALGIVAQKPANTSVPVLVHADCLGNLMGVILYDILPSGQLLEVAAADRGTFVPITEKLASQCGFRWAADPWGHVKLYASAHNCFAESSDDELFDLTLSIGASGPSPAAQIVQKTCPYPEWASRDIICNDNYMEVSVRRRIPTVEEFEKGDPESGEADDWDEAEQLVKLWKVQFHTGEAVAMTQEEAYNNGYSLFITPSRAILRSPLNTPLTTSLDVAGVPMQVMHASTYLKRKWMVKLLDSATACPTGGVTFTDTTITWRLPVHISPLLLSNHANILEYHFGIDGRRVDPSIMAQMNHTLTITDTYFIVEMPIGSPDGYYKSVALDYQYHITYHIEPMLEVLWKEDAEYDDTRYKVLYPIVTPPMPRPPQIQDYTVPENRVFDFTVDSFLYDVLLVNITFTTGVMSVAEANARGFNVYQYARSDGLMGYSLQVPFSDPVVLIENNDIHATDYVLPVTFGFVVLPENAPFSHSGVLRATLHDVVLPTVTGTCDLEYFYVTVTYGSRGHDFVTVVGERDLTPEMAQEYKFTQNDTHFSIAVHYLAQDVVFEMVLGSSLRSKLNLYLNSPIKQEFINDFSLTCSFPMSMIECFSNGTMTALAVKVESVKDLDMSQLTLKDSRCRPTYVDHVFAFFSFSVNSCGTTRKFMDNYMIYENEVSLESGKVATSADQYLLTISCIYGTSATYILPFTTMPNPEPVADAAMGVFSVRMQLALDSSYQMFHLEEQYPVVKSLREPLYFEVELLRSTDPQVELFLDNCWATAQEDRTSVPKWDLIVDGCENLADPYETIFHPVSTDARVRFHSHFKRFEVKMFTFTVDNVPLGGQVFVHCDVVICDANSPTDSLCGTSCLNKQHMSPTKRVRRSIRNAHVEQVSSGQIVLI